jgi:hypothetical protein
MTDLVLTVSSREKDSLTDRSRTAPHIGTHICRDIYREIGIRTDKDMCIRTRRGSGNLAPHRSAPQFLRRQWVPAFPDNDEVRDLMHTYTKWCQLSPTSGLRADYNFPQDTSSWKFPAT